MEAPQDPHLAAIVTWAFYAMISFIGGRGVMLLARLEQSVESLNEKIAVIISRVDTHEKRLDRHEDLLTKK